MALKREMLKSMGLTDDQITTIIDGHTETVNALKTERDDWKAKAGQFETLRAERDSLQQQLDARQGETDWKAEYDKLKTATEAKETAAKVEKAFRGILKAEHVDESLHDVIVRGTDLSGHKLGKDGRLTDAEAVAESIRQTYAGHIVTTETHGTPAKTPPKGENKPMRREDVWAKDDKGRYKLTTQQRQQALMEHPELMSPGT